MPSKKKKFNSRFPPARIKKIMQSDDEVGKVAAVVPVIISKALELFVESLLKKATEVTKSRNARTLTPAHLKASIMSEAKFSFLKDVVAAIADIHQSGDDEQSDGNASGPSISAGVLASHKRRVYKTNSSTGRSRGRPKKSTSSTSQDNDEDEDDDEDIEDEDNETIDEDEDEEENGSNNATTSFNQSTTSTTVSNSVQPTNLTSVIQENPFCNKRRYEEDDDYDT